MSRRRGIVFAGSYDEELREALAANPNFAQAPNSRGSYWSTRAEGAAAAAAAVPDANSDPPCPPTVASEGRADAEGAGSQAAAASLPRRSKRSRLFHVDRDQAEPSSANRPTRELLTTRETVRERLLRIQISSFESSDLGLAGSPLLGRRSGSARSTPSVSTEFAGDNSPSTNASSCLRTHITHKPSQPAANCASDVSTVTMPRAHRRKQNHPYRCPVV